jgi:hypothetical protein
VDAVVGEQYLYEINLLREKACPYSGMTFHANLVEKALDFA